MHSIAVIQWYASDASSAMRSMPCLVSWRHIWLPGCAASWICGQCLLSKGFVSVGHMFMHTPWLGFAPLGRLHCIELLTRLELRYEAIIDCRLSVHGLTYFNVEER